MPTETGVSVLLTCYFGRCVTGK